MRVARNGNRHEHAMWSEVEELDTTDRGTEAATAAPVTLGMLQCW